MNLDLNGSSIYHNTWYLYTGLDGITILILKLHKKYSQRIIYCPDCNELLKFKNRSAPCPKCNEIYKIQFDYIYREKPIIMNDKYHDKNYGTFRLYENNFDFSTDLGR